MHIHTFTPSVHHGSAVTHMTTPTVQLHLSLSQWHEVQLRCLGWVTDSLCLRRCWEIECGGCWYTRGRMQTTPHYKRNGGRHVLDWSESTLQKTANLQLFDLSTKLARHSAQTTICDGDLQNERIRNAWAIEGVTAQNAQQAVLLQRGVRANVPLLQATTAWLQRFST